MDAGVALPIILAIIAALTASESEPLEHIMHDTFRGPRQWFRRWRASRCERVAPRKQAVGMEEER